MSSLIATLFTVSTFSLGCAKGLGVDGGVLSLGGGVIFPPSVCAVGCVVAIGCSSDTTGSVVA